MIGVHVRWMIRSDIPSVMRIEEECFEFPWSEDVFFKQLRQRNCIGMVAELGDVVCGFMVYEIHPSHICVLNLAVGIDHQQYGVGQAMTAKLSSKLSFGRRSRIYCEIRETNINALNFFKSQGYRASRIIRDRYKETNEDAIEMVYRLPVESEKSIEPRFAR